MVRAVYMSDHVDTCVSWLHEFIAFAAIERQVVALLLFYDGHGSVLFHLRRRRVSQ